MNKLIYIFSLLQVVISANFAVGQTNSFSEKTYLQTDRDIYIAGEDLFFKLYGLNSETGKPTIASKFAYIILRNEKSLVISAICVKLENSMASSSIYLPDTLSTGRYQLVSFTNCMRNFGEQTFFTKEILVANRFDKDLSSICNSQGTTDTVPPKTSAGSVQNKGKELITITTEKKSYSKREKISVLIDAPGMGEDEVANFSITVHEKIPFYNEYSGNSNYLVNDGQPLQMLSKQGCIYIPEINGMVLQGRVDSMENNNPITGSTIFLSSPDTMANLQVAKTDRSGNFRFQLNDYYTGKNLIISLPYTQHARIKLDNKYELKTPFKSSREFPGSFLKDYLIKSQNIVQIQKAYKVETQKEAALNQKSGLFPPWVYPPKPDAVYPADFVSLPDFIEISRELLPILKTRKNDNSYETRLYNFANSQYFFSDPMIFLDGVPINNIGQIINLGSEQINKIVTMGVERYFGDLYFSGILAVYTKKMEIDNIVWVTPTITVMYPSIQPFSMFVTADHSITDKSPDFRQLLYWEPFLSMAAKEKTHVEFSASDNIGEYAITIEGVTNKGNMFITNAFINIGSNTK